MANKSRFIIAESSIKTFFIQSEDKVFSKSQLFEILEQKRILWNLPISMNSEKFIERLINSGILKQTKISFEGIIDGKIRYLVPNASIFEVASSLINKSYLSHYSAVFIHGLTNQIPKTVYVTFEQSQKRNINRNLLQENIDKAFLGSQRKSGTTSIYEGFTLLVHNGMYSNKAGVYILNNVPVTNLERTLIDITVRPNYSGGVHSVFEIYKKAIEKISINKLTALLDKLNFIYPYHQSIGFYLERAGFDSNRLEILHKKEMPFNFYLTYEIKEKAFDPKWKIYYPKEM